MSRHVHVLFALVVLLVTSGCTLPGADLTAEASPATVSERAMEGSDYALDSQGEIAFNETLGVAGEDRNVGVTNHIVKYASADHEGQFVVFSTPSPETDSAPANPFADTSERRDVGRMFGEVNNTTSLTVTDRRNVTTLGQSTEMVTYETTNRTATGTTPVFIHVVIVEHQGDAVVAVGVHPQSTDESDVMEQFVAGLEHGESS